MITRQLIESIDKSDVASLLLPYFILWRLKLRTNISFENTFLVFVDRIIVHLVVEGEFMR